MAKKTKENQEIEPQANQEQPRARRAGNADLHQANRVKNDEFYTLFNVIEQEMNAYLEYNPDVFRDKVVLLPCDDPEWSNFTKYFAQNFNTLGLRKLISTSFAHESKNYQSVYTPSIFETQDEKFDEKKTKINGKIFILDKDKNGDNFINIDDLEWDYLESDGDFRSAEVTKLRDEADIIVTNPPFSLFREFINWIMEGGKKFAVIGNMNAISYRDFFPFIKENKVWLGVTNFNTGMYFYVPDNFEYRERYRFQREMNGRKVNRVAGVCWFTNLEHGRRHQPLALMTMEENRRFNNTIINDLDSYCRYENYDAIEVPCVSGIPNDYDGVMGVPITFISKYCPDQFEIIGMGEDNGRGHSGGVWLNIDPLSCMIGSTAKYKRLFIHRKNNK